MLKRYLKLPFFLLFITMIFTQQAQAQYEIPVINEPTSIARQTTKNFNFGTVSQNNTTVLLSLRSHINSTTLGGSTYLLKMMLNGREVTAAVSRAAVRLQNKPLTSPVTPDLSALWYGNSEGWRIIYAPDSTAAKNQQFYVDDPYLLVLDITDLTNPAGENRLELTNLSSDMIAQYSGTQAELVLSELKVTVINEESPMMKAAQQVVAPVINRGERNAQPASYQGKLLPGGGFEVRVNNQTWNFSSAFSYPNAGLNHFTPTQKAHRRGEQEWTLDSPTSSAPTKIMGRSRYYDVERTVNFTPRRVEINDVITNKTTQPLGMLVRHEMDTSSAGEPLIRLAGNPNPALSDYYSPGNPSVHVTMPDHTIALLCEDDVFRNQARLYTTEGKVGIRTEMLMLQPGETYQQKWAVYPVASVDYFDFVNLVRQDWKANYTVEGAWYWGYDPDRFLAMPIEEIRDKFRRLGIRYTTIGGGWIDHKTDPRRIGFGAGVMEDFWADYRRRVKASAERIREAVPECKVLAYYNNHRDTSENGLTKYADSFMTDRNGNIVSTEWNGEFSHPTYTMTATLSNRFGMDMLKVAQEYLDEMGLDGIYWDEMENLAWGTPMFTTLIPDGKTCELDLKTYTIKRELGNTVLLTEKHRLAVLKIVNDKGGILLGNGPVATHASLQTNAQRMSEIYHNEYWPYEGHFQSPLGYMGDRLDFGNMVRALKLALLPVGTQVSLDYPHDISRHLFPFTPIELHSGYLWGQERIITTHDGNFGWDENFEYRLWIFDSVGNKKEQNPAWQKGNGRIPVEVPKDGVVIIERKPV